MANCSPIGEQWRTVRPLANNGELSKLDGWSIQSSGNMFAGMANIDDGGGRLANMTGTCSHVIVVSFAISDGLRTWSFLGDCIIAVVRSCSPTLYGVGAVFPCLRFLDRVVRKIPLGGSYWDPEDPDAPNLA